MPTRPFDPACSPIGALLPDFTVRTIDGRTVHRRDFKGHRHLVICFAPLVGADAPDAPVDALAAQLPSWRAERAELLFCLPAGAVLPDEGGLGLVVADHDGPLRERFGVGPGAALFIADRYGEIVFHAVGSASFADLPLGEVLPILERIEMRCSL